MTISTREAMNAGKLGGDVLELAKERAGEPRQVIGVDVATPDGDRTVATVDSPAPQSILDVCEDCGESLPVHSVAQHLVAHVRAKPARDMLTAARRILGGCNVATAASEDLRQLTELMGLDLGTSRGGIVDALKKAEWIAHPMRLVRREDNLSYEDREALLAVIGDLSSAGAVVLPKGIDFAIVEPAWPNPSKVEPGQIWHFDGLGSYGGSYGGRFVVTDIDEHGCAGLRYFDRPMRRHEDGSVEIDAGCSCSAVIDRRSPARCIGFELDDGRRIMVGEWREPSPGRDPWKVRAIVEHGIVALGTRRHEDRGATVEDVADWPVVDAPPALREVKYTFVATGAEEIGAAFQRIANAAERAAARVRESTTMRAECAASDVTEGEQSREDAPPTADCGPSFRRPIGPAVQAMIDAGYTVDPSLL